MAAERAGVLQTCVLITAQMHKISHVSFQTSVNASSTATVLPFGQTAAFQPRRWHTASLASRDIT